MIHLSLSCENAAGHVGLRRNCSLCGAWEYAYDVEGKIEKIEKENAELITEIDGLRASEPYTAGWIEYYQRENTELRAKLDEAVSALENIEASYEDEILITAKTESIVMYHFAREALAKIRGGKP